MRLAYPVLISALFIPALGMAQTSMSPSPMSSGMQSTSGTLSMQDSTFIKTVARAGLAEVQDGQLAQSNGNSAVQAVGARMVTDHTKANDQLKSIAMQLGATVPSAPTAHDAAMTEKLQALHGSAFDAMYLKGQKMAHIKAIAAFKQEISMGGNAQLKAFATQTLPTLQEHLKMIEMTSA